MNFLQLEMAKYRVTEEIWISEKSDQSFPWTNVGKEEGLSQKLEAERNKKIIVDYPLSISFQCNLTTFKNL